MTFRIATLHSKEVIPEDVADAAVAAFFLDLKGLLKRMKAGRRGELLGGGGDDGIFFMNPKNDLFSKPSSHTRTQCMPVNSLKMGPYSLGWIA